MTVRIILVVIALNGGSWQGAKVTAFSGVSRFFFFFFRFFINEPTAQTAHHISVINGSNNVVPWKVIAFRVQNHIRYSFGGHFPPKPPFLAHFRQIATVRELRARTAIQTKPVDQILWFWAQITSHDLRYDIPEIFFKFSN